ncbi:hypothetical protein OROMI_001838 [Orobanche minor]
MVVVPFSGSLLPIFTCLPCKSLYTPELVENALDYAESISKLPLLKSPS